jgi:outer membrane protein assembly factor BamD (BamD/ComL family)
LLARWGVIGDPWHPRFAATLATHGRDIAAFLQTSEASLAWQTAEERLALAEERLAEAEVALAPWLRLEAALAAARRARAVLGRPAGDAGRRHLEALLRCERGL